MNVYSFTLAFHSWLRWVVLILAIVAIARALNGWFSKKDWTGTDARWASWFANIISIQLVVGLLLLFISPSVKSAMGMDMSEVMKDSQSRMLLVEHPIGMLLGVTLVHIGKSKARKARTSLESHRKAAIFFLIAMIIILGSIPWGDSELFRAF